MAAEDCTASILESLHQRVARLEDVWNVGYSLVETRQPFELALMQTGIPAMNSLFSAINAEPGKVLRGNIWVNPQSNLGAVSRVVIRSEIIAREVSNGMACILIVCSGTINSVNVILKFRMVEERSEKFTEQEAKHALDVMIDKRLDGLFPKLYCVFKVRTQYGMTFECIGTEPLSELSNEDCKNTVIQLQCVALLKKLHGCGYVHGDPHLGNFMKKFDARGSPRVYMIDQDEIRRLPADDAVISKYMQMLDYQTLVFWNNPRCPALNIIDGGGGGSHLPTFAYNLWKAIGYFNVVFGPELFYHIVRDSVQTMRIKLGNVNYSMQENGSAVVTTYLQYLGRPDVSEEYIDKRFADLIRDDSLMKFTNNLITDMWLKNRLPAGLARR
jgi:hypothetical protein